jgi:DNA-directed RNA polymerase subunit RPC12/RpoP
MPKAITVEDKDEQTNVKCRHCNSESVEIIARGTESILYKCKVCKMEFAKLNIKEVEP